MTCETHQRTTVTVQGLDVPKLGYGTWLLKGEVAYEGVLDALTLGYRHIDTARSYGNERDIGHALADTDVPREEIWLTTNIWHDDAAPDDLRRTFAQQLQDLDVDYVDLLLLHWPAKIPLVETLQAMNELHEQGLALRIGVSNFPSSRLLHALQIAPIFANQVELHPYLSQDQMRQLCLKHDLLLAAYSPLAHGLVHEDPVLTAIGARHGVSPEQIALRWLLDQPNVAALPKAASHKHRTQNLDVFDLQLSREDHNQIAGLSRNARRTIDPPWAPEWD
jgi:2,5-diketo-D-gluconate reductase B